jgi:tight adherence protein B
MAFTMSELWYAAILATTLVAIILLATAIYHFIIVPARKRRNVARRLTEEVELLRRVQILKEKSKDGKNWRGTLFNKLLGANRFDKLQTFMLQADLYKNAGTFLTFVLLSAAAGFLVGTWVLANVLFGSLIAISLGILPFIYLTLKRRSKSLKFEKQMPDAMELLSRSLRAGHTLPSAIELLGEEMDAPMGTETKIAYEEQKYGLSVPDSLLNMLQRVESMDLRYFVSAVLIQQETGGNLAELMENIAHIIRSRLNFKAKVRGLTATGRFSAGVMIIVPVLAFFGLMAVAPHYERILFTSSLGRMMLLGGIMATLIGAFLLRKLVRSVET